MVDLEEIVERNSHHEPSRSSEVALLGSVHASDSSFSSEARHEVDKGESIEQRVLAQRTSTERAFVESVSDVSSLFVFVVAEA